MSQLQTIQLVPDPVTWQDKELRPKPLLEKWVDGNHHGWGLLACGSVLEEGDLMAFTVTEPNRHQSPFMMVPVFPGCQVVVQ
jgi:hypothetical protein